MRLGDRKYGSRLLRNAGLERQYLLVRREAMEVALVVASTCNLVTIRHLG